MRRFSINQISKKEIGAIPITLKASWKIGMRHSLLTLGSGFILLVLLLVFPLACSNKSTVAIIRFTPQTPTPTATTTPTVTTTPAVTMPSYVNQWSFGSGFPMDMAVNGSTLYLAACSYDFELFNLGNLSTPVNTWSGYGSTVFAWVQGVAVNPLNGNVYVLDYGADTVYQFTSAGAAVNASTYPFNNPYDIATDSSGNYYVPDMANAAVYEFNPSNTLLKTWTTAGPNAFVWPSAVAFDSLNNIYIADASAEKLYELQAGTNTLLNTWSLPNYALFYQMAINGSGLVYAPDFNNQIVEEFIPGTSGPVTTWNGSQGGGTAFTGPVGIVILPNGNILVSDYYSDLLEEYSP